MSFGKFSMSFLRAPDFNTSNYFGNNLAKGLAEKLFFRTFVARKENK